MIACMCVCVRVCTPYVCVCVCVCVCAQTYAYIGLPGEKVLLGVDPLVYDHRSVLLERNKWRRREVVGAGGAQRVVRKTRGP
jgi:hypothetical protein